MSYDMNEPTNKYDPPDIAREDERHELDTACAIEAAILQFGAKWVKRLVQQVEAEQAEQKAERAQPVDDDEPVCPI